MTDAEATRFAHPIGNTILDELIDGQACEYALDKEGVDIIMKAAALALETPEAGTMLNVIEEVADFLDTQDGAEASATLRQLLQALEIKATEIGLEFEGFEDDDGVEATFGRRAASIVGERQTQTAPKLGEEKPEGAISLQALLGTKRRM